MRSLDRVDRSLSPGFTLPTANLPVVKFKEHLLFRLGLLSLTIRHALGHVKDWLWAPAPRWWPDGLRR